MKLNAIAILSIAVSAMFALSCVASATTAVSTPEKGGNITDKAKELDGVLKANKSSNFDFGKSVGGFFKSVGGALGAAGSAIGSGLVVFGKGLVFVFSVIGSGLGAAFVWLGKVLPPLGAAMWNGIVFIFGAIGSGMVWLVGAIGTAFTAIGALLSNLAALIWSLKPNGMTDVQYGAIMAGSACGTGGASYGIWYWVKKVAPGGMGLFTRIPREEILQNETRRQIYSAIQRNPGINMSQLSQQLNIGWGTTVHHVKKLEEATKIHAENMNNERCFFENGGTFSKESMVKTAALKDGTAKSIFGFIEKNPGTSQKRICESLGVRPSLVSWHVTKLEQEGIINRNRNGKSFSLTINEKFDISKAKETPAV
ncbi:MAG: winged helix-turn-helix transcriptional regulator [Candidatus Thermoplasmatota archaeon]|nr:winged helix-turn-helix transcriptional regulator [Candidatus Thermoplasmatota archaeon]